MTASLIAAGNFSFSGDGSVVLNAVARWNGASWESVGGGVIGPVKALTVHDGALVAGGYFLMAGGVSANRIAQWDGMLWQPMAEGVGGYGSDTRVEALTQHAESLVAGGYFATAGDIMSAYWARWGPVCPTGDVSGDGLVNVNDLLVLIDSWGTCPAPPSGCAADLTGDAQVNVDDLLIVISNWS